MIVVDTNVIVYLLLPNDATETSRAALARDPTWEAPLLWRSELRNVLATYVRRRLLTLDEALDVQRMAVEQMTGHEHPVDGVEVLRIATASGRTAYDCEFVVLARSLGVSLVTSDRQVLASFPETAVALATFGAG